MPLETAPPVMAPPPMATAMPGVGSHGASGPAIVWPVITRVPGEKVIPARYVPSALVRLTGFNAAAAAALTLLSLLGLARPAVLWLVVAFGVLTLLLAALTVFTWISRARACFRELSVGAAGQPGQQQAGQALEALHYFLLGGFNIPMALALVLLAQGSDPRLALAVSCGYFALQTLLLGAEAVLFRVLEQRLHMRALRALIVREAQRRDQRLRQLALPKPTAAAAPAAGPAPTAAPATQARTPPPRAAVPRDLSARETV